MSQFPQSPEPEESLGVYIASPIMRYFAYSHLPPTLQAISKPIGDVAEHFDRTLPNSAEKNTGLRKLLEAKDCLVRASMP